MIRTIAGRGYSRTWIILILAAGLAFALALQVVYGLLDLNEFRDNIRYRLVYGEMASEGIAEAYRLMRFRDPGPKASEPIFFGLFYLGSLSVPWTFWVLIKNVIFVNLFLVMVWKAAGRLSEDRWSLYLLAVACFTDFYLIQMGLVIHKLSIAMALFGGAYLLAGSKANIPGVVLASLTHFQMVLTLALLPFDKLWKRIRSNPTYGFRVVAGTAAVFVAAALIRPIREGFVSKVRFYFANTGGFQLHDLRALALGAVFAMVYLKLQPRNLTPFVLLAVVLIAGFLVGYERVLFLLYWGSIFGIATSTVSLPWRATLVGPFVAYNVYRLVSLFAGS